MHFRTLNKNLHELHTHFLWLSNRPQMLQPTITTMELKIGRYSRFWAEWGSDLDSFWMRKLKRGPRLFFWLQTDLDHCCSHFGSHLSHFGPFLSKLLKGVDLPRKVQIGKRNSRSTHFKQPRGVVCRREH